MTVGPLRLARATVDLQQLEPDDAPHAEPDDAPHADLVAGTLRNVTRGAAVPDAQPRARGQLDSYQAFDLMAYGAAAGG